MAALDAAFGFHLFDLARASAPICALLKKIIHSKPWSMQFITPMAMKCFQPDFFKKYGAS